MARQCSRVSNGHCGGASPIHCFDGACVASHAACVTRRLQLLNPLAVFNVTSDYTNACGAGLTLCPDGSCAHNMALCRATQVCGGSTPKGCVDGSCIALTANCTAVPACSGSAFRCSDGICRTNSSVCPPSDRCPAATPVYCANHVTGDGALCVATAALCTTTAQTVPSNRPSPCSTNCERDLDVPYITQVVPAELDAVIDVNTNRARL